MIFDAAFVVACYLPTLWRSRRPAAHLAERCVGALAFFWFQMHDEAVNEAVAIINAVNVLRDVQDIDQQQRIKKVLEASLSRLCEAVAEINGHTKCGPQG